MPAFDLRVLSYVAGLELAVDRLRKQWRLLHRETVDLILPRFPVEGRLN